MTDLRRETLKYLQQHRVMTLAVQDEGTIWAAAVFYVNLDFRLFFLSADHTRHARYLAANPWTAATIQEDYIDWREIKGIQLEGAVTRLADADRELAIAAYVGKYPFVIDPRSGMQPLLAVVNWYCLTPSKLFFIDNSKGLGHRDEVPLYGDERGA